MTRAAAVGATAPKGTPCFECGTPIWLDKSTDNRCVMDEKGPHTCHPERLGPAPVSKTETTPDRSAWPVLVVDGPHKYRWPSGRLAMHGTAGDWGTYTDDEATSPCGAYGSALEAATALQARLPDDPAPVVDGRDQRLADVRFILGGIEGKVPADAAANRSNVERALFLLRGDTGEPGPDEAHISRESDYKRLRANLLRALNEAPDGHGEALTDEEIVGNVAHYVATKGAVSPTLIDAIEAAKALNESHAVAACLRIIERECGGKL